jgi:hypothetical protein
MGIDIVSETLIRLADVSKLKNVPSQRGKGVAISTLWRWRSAGIKGIKLETLQVGGTTCTSMEALQRFFDALTERAAQANAPVPAEFPSKQSQTSFDRLPAYRRRQIEEAERRLRKAGV